MHNSFMILQGQQVKGNHTSHHSSTKCTIICKKKQLNGLPY